MFGSFAFFRGFINHGKFGPASGGGANQKNNLENDAVGLNASPPSPIIARRAAQLGIFPLLAPIEKGPS
jgi:hypothetical protein